MSNSLKFVALLSTQGLSPAESEILLNQFTELRKLPAGKFFLKQGQVSTEIGIVIKGKCRYFYNTKDGEVTRWISLPNDYVTSLTSFISQMPAKDNIQVMEATEIVVMPRTNWLKVFEGYEFVRALWTRTIEANYLGMEERVFNLIALSAEERYDWMLKHQPQFIREVPDKYLASMLGMNPRHLSRIRAQKK